MTDYEKLQGLCNEIDQLIEQGVSSSDPSFQAWHTKTERFLIKRYGADSYEHKKFSQQHFSLLIYAGGIPESEYIKACRYGLEETKAIFQTYLEDMQEEAELVTEHGFSNHADFSKVFIVHGHDGELKEAVTRLIERQGIKPIILNEQANLGKTIIEKIEYYGDAHSAICLFTADDFGGKKGETESKPRARQNVIFEAGYFIGKNGRENVVIIAESGIEMPSDLQGVVYTDKCNWQFSMLKELKAAGYKIDYNKLDD